MLHMVNKSPFTNNGLESCLRFARPGDAILLFEDGVYGAISGTAKSTLVENALKNHKVYTIRADIKARGLTQMIAGVNIIGYGEFVDLVEQNKTHSWL